MNQEDILKEYAENNDVINDSDKSKKVKPIRPSNADVAKEAAELRKTGQLNYLGWQELDIESLPSKGLFYPEGTKIYVRAATGGEIKHWSTMNVEKFEEVDAHINYVIEKCCKISIPNDEYMGGSWKDLNDIDRLYILFAIRDFTFPVGNNELMFNVSENEQIPIIKDNIDFINFPEELMKYYDEHDRCFKLRFKNGKVINLYITTLGVGNWLKNYITQKQQAREQVDQDFLMYAPLLIKSYRRFSVRAYEAMIEESTNWGIQEWSALSHFRDIIMSQTEPMIRYTDEAGLERSAPLTFRGGFKSIFTVSDPLQGLL